jgi:hypothetical protein
MGPMMAPEAPAAAPFYTNLANDPCTGMMYNVSNGYFVLGPNNCFAPGSTQWIAYPFVASHAGNVKKVQLALTNDTAICTPTTSKATVQIYDNSLCNGTPGVALGSPVVANIASAPPGLSTANFGTTGPALAAGTWYWVVVTTSSAPTQTGDTAVWWQANSAAQAFNLNDGNGWQAFDAGSPGGFSVQ